MQVYTDGRAAWSAVRIPRRYDSSRPSEQPSSGPRTCDFRVDYTSPALVLETDMEQ